MFRYALLSVLLAAALGVGAEAARPKNVILMIGDGMGHNHVEAGSLYAYGASKAQPYWQWTYFPVATFSSNNQQGYAVDVAWKDFNYFLKLPTDSAAAATTYATGVKTRNYMIGVDAEGNHVPSLVDDAEAMGKATGVVSSVRFTHATPASFVAHAKSRKDELEIGQEMLRDSKVDVILGPGHPLFDDDAKQSAEPNYKFVGGEDLWKQLQGGTLGGDADGDGTPDPWKLVDTTEGIQALGSGTAPKRLFGLVPVAGTLQAERGGDHKAEAYAVPFLPNVPTLSDLMLAALNSLKLDGDGFFLMGEGGAIDWASHSNNPGRMVEEQIAFDEAIAAVAAWVEANSSWEDTLLIVTADHECGYVVGPGSDPEWKPLVNNGKGVMPGFEFKLKSHTNQLVPLFAKGAGAEGFAEYVIGEDTRLGKFIDNTSVAALIRKVWR
jgi:alkaline phosphatase